MGLTVLNVGGGGSRVLPAEYNGWEQKVLDVDPAVNPDIVMDAREMWKADPDEFDAVYSSHCLEHFYLHEVVDILKGFRRVLKPGGRVDVITPDVVAAVKDMISRSLEPTDVFYRTGSGDPITFHDVMYGWGPMMKSGNLYYAHKCGFSAAMLGGALVAAGFDAVRLEASFGNLRATGIKGQ